MLDIGVYYNRKFEKSSPNCPTIYQGGLLRKVQSGLIHGFKPPLAFTSQPCSYHAIFTLCSGSHGDHLSIYQVSCYRVSLFSLYNFELKLVGTLTLWILYTLSRITMTCHPYYTIKE